MQGHAEPISNRFLSEAKSEFAGILRNQSEFNNQFFKNELRFLSRNLVRRGDRRYG
jgi:hypothetical protein